MHTKIYIENKYYKASVMLHNKHWHEEVDFVKISEN